MTKKKTGIVPFQSKDGPRYRIVARNGEILATSEAYSSKQARDEGMEALRRAVLRDTIGRSRQGEYLRFSVDEDTDALVPTLPACRRDQASVVEVLGKRVSIALDGVQSALLLVPRSAVPRHLDITED